MPIIRNYSHRAVSALVAGAALASLLGATLALAGCGLGAAGASNSGMGGGGSTSTAKFTGLVFGGQQPIQGSTVQLYAVGTTGIGSASTAIGTPVTTDANGTFSLDGTYTCTNATQIYLLASGGNAGTGTNNSATVEAAALGSCATFLANAATEFINVNELTTVAVAYALAPFATDSLHIGATGSNPVGLVNAFASAQELVNVPTGTVGGASLPAGATVPSSEIDTLGDIIAACVNSAGPAASPCQSLATATGAGNTLDALIAIAKNPGSSANVALYSIATAMSPFQPTLSSQPNDFSIAVTYNASGGLSAPYGIAIDASGDAWITNAAGTSIVELSPSGSVSETGTAAGLAGPQSIAVDKTGNVWVANTNGNSVIKFTVSGGAITGSTAYTAGGVNAPTSVAVDSANNVFVANFNGNSVTGLTSAGSALSGSPYTASSLITNPSSLAIGPDGSVYVTTGSGAAIKLAGSNQSSPGAYLATFTDNVLQGPTALALDTSGDVLLVGSTTGTAVAGNVSQFSSAGTVTQASPVTTGSSIASAIAFDGSSFWIANSSTSAGLTQIAYSSTAVTSPSGGFGLLNLPQGIAIDSAGSIWTTNAGSNTVAHYIGMAKPVTTPTAATVGP